LCRNQALVKNRIIWLNSRLKEYRTDWYKTVEDKELYMECSAVKDVPRTYM